MSNMVSNIPGSEVVTLKRRFLSQLKSQLIEAKKITKALSKIRSDLGDPDKTPEEKVVIKRGSPLGKYSEEKFLDFQIRLEHSIRELEMFNLKELSSDGM